MNLGDSLYKVQSFSPKNISDDNNNQKKRPGKKGINVNSAVIGYTMMGLKSAIPVKVATSAFLYIYPGIMTGPYAPHENVEFTTCILVYSQYARS